MVWSVILAFVGTQLAWNLRPFLGDRDKGFSLFREYEGNFYTAIIYSFEQLASEEDEVDNEAKKYDDFVPKYEKSDSIDILHLKEE